jgi:hypothetical protein
MSALFDADDLEVKRRVKRVDQPPGPPSTSRAA